MLYNGVQQSPKAGGAQKRRYGWFSQDTGVHSGFSSLAVAENWLLNLVLNFLPTFFCFPPLFSK